MSASENLQYAAGETANAAAHAARSEWMEDKELAEDEAREALRQITAAMEGLAKAQRILKRQFPAAYHDKARASMKQAGE